MTNKGRPKTRSMNLSGFVLWLENLPQAKMGDAQNRILKLLEDVKQICGINTKEVLAGVDFDPSDHRHEKLEAIISELRSVVFLNEKRFTNIRLQGRRSNEKNFDIAAALGDKKFAIEVKCLTKKNSRAKIKEADCYSLDETKFVKSLETLALEKKPQLDISSPSHAKMIIFVVNRTPEQELYTSEDYKNILRSLSTKLSWGNDYFFGVVTGVPDENSIYPELK